MSHQVQGQGHASGSHGQLRGGDGSWMGQNGGLSADQGTNQRPHSSLIAPGGGLYGAVGGAMPAHASETHARMGHVSLSAQQQHLQQQTPFERDSVQQHIGSNNQYNNNFGKVRSGQTLADSRNSWRSDSSSWRSGGGNSQSSNTWRTSSGSGWRDAGDQRGSHGHHNGGSHAQHTQHGYQSQGNQVSSLMSMMSLNGRNSNTAQGEQSSTVPATFGPGGGRYGTMPFGPSKAVYRYPTETLAKLYRQLLYTGRLGLPKGVQRDEPMLFTSAGEFVDVVEQLQGVARRPKNAYIDVSSFYASRENSIDVAGGGSMGSRQQSQVIGGMSGMSGISGMSVTGNVGGVGFIGGISGVSGMQHAQIQSQQPRVVSAPAFPASFESSDMYLYVDPQGQWQGPFSRAEMLEWHAAGFFPMSLVVKSASGSQVARLSDWLALWNGPAPTGFSILQEQEAFTAQPQTMPHQVEMQPVQPPAPVQSLGLGVETEPVLPIETNSIELPAVEQSIEQAEEVVQPEDRKGNVLEDHPTRTDYTPPTAPEAPWLGSQSIESSVSLRDIQQEEDAKKAEIDEIKAKALAQQRKLRSGQNGWASVARNESLSLADIQNEEIKANTEKSAKEAAAAAASLQKQQQKIASGGMWAAAASKPANSGVAVPSPHAGRMPHNKSLVVPPPPPPPVEKPQTASPASPSFISSPVDSLAFGLETPTSEQGALIGDFREWCSQQMKSLTGSDEVTLCEFLMGVESNSEIADYIRMYLGSTAAVATFSSEFIKRKLAVMAARELTAGGKKKSRKARAKANKALAAVSAGTENGSVTNKTADDSSWEKVAKGGKGHGATVEKGSSNGLSKSRPAGFALLSGKGN